jgi:putative transposase
VSRSIIPLGLPGLKLHLGSVTRRLSGANQVAVPPGVTMLLATALRTLLRALSTGAAGVALENLALRHQLLVLHRSVGRPRLSRWDRIFWVWLSRLWAGWRTTLVIVRPATVLVWHRRGFQLYWRWKSGPNPVGRPRLDAELRTLIRRMARENPTCGRRRIQAELALLGYAVAELTVAKYMHRTSPRPSPTWRVFLATHARDIVAVDFFLVPTLTFRLLFVFVVLRHERRELLHINVTDHPTAVWTAQQIIEAFPDDSAPRFLLRDRDAIYGEEFARRVKSRPRRQRESRSLTVRRRHERIGPMGFLTWTGRTDLTGDRVDCRVRVAQETRRNYSGRDSE